MLTRRALSSACPSAVAVRGLATTRALMNNNNNTTSDPATSTNSGKSGYDRDAELKREEAARANLFTQGVPNPFKAGAGAGGPQTGGMGNKPSFKEASDEAWREASKKMFGSEQPPAQFNFIAKMFGKDTQAGANSSDSTAAASSSTETTTTSSSSSSSNGSSNSGGQQMPPNPFANFGAGGGSSSSSGGAGAPQPPRTGRLLAGLVITYCSFWMMRRQGFFGHFDHVQVPYWAVGPADSAKWLLFVHNMDEARRADLFASFEAQKRMYPGMNFFDFVDQQQPDWCSTPNFSRDEVITTIAQFVATNPTWKVDSTMRAGLNASDGIFAAFGISGDGGSGLTPAQRRIESLMRIIPGANGGLSRPFVMARTTDTSGAPTGGWQPMYQAGVPPAGFPQQLMHGGGGFPPQPGMNAAGFQPQAQHQSPHAHQQWGQPQHPQHQQVGHGTAPFGMPPQQQQQQQQWPGQYQQQQHQWPGNHGQPQQQQQPPQWAQQQSEQQYQQQDGAGTSQPSSQDHGQACTDGFVNPDAGNKDLPKDSSAL